MNLVLLTLLLGGFVALSLSQGYGSIQDGTDNQQVKDSEKNADGSSRTKNRNWKNRENKSNEANKEVKNKRKTRCAEDNPNTTDAQKQKVNGTLAFGFGGMKNMTRNSDKEETKEMKFDKMHKNGTMFDKYGLNHKNFTSGQGQKDGKQWQAQSGTGKGSQSQSQSQVAGTV